MQSLPDERLLFFFFFFFFSIAKWLYFQPFRLLLIPFEESRVGQNIICLSQAMRKGVLYHMRTTKAQISLISAFVVGCLDSIKSLDSIAEISRLQLAFVVAQAGLCLAWSESPEDTFSHDEARFYISFKYEARSPVTSTMLIRNKLIDLKYSYWCLHSP